MYPGDRLRHQTVVEGFYGLGCDGLVIPSKLLLAVKSSTMIGLSLIMSQKTGFEAANGATVAEKWQVTAPWPCEAS